MLPGGLGPLRGLPLLGSHTAPVRLSLAVLSDAHSSFLALLLFPKMLNYWRTAEERGPVFS